MKRTVSVWILLLALMVPTAWAADIDLTKSSYTDNELQQLRVWEKQWVGKKISSATIEQVREFLPETFYKLMKDTERWGESWFLIVPYKQIPLSPGMKKYTEQYFGQPRIGDNGEMLGWIAGVPFPEAKSGIEMAHNFRNRTYGDAIITDEKGYIVDGRLKYDMDVKITNRYNYFVGRTDTPPVPEYKNNIKKIWRAFQMLQLAPPETRNLRIVEINYKDRMKSYDSWFWLPSVRRVRRRSTTERQDAQGGADFCGFDNFGWDGPVQLNTYKYLGQKDLLMARHDDGSKLEHTPGDCLWDGVQRERIKMHLIEAVNQDPNFLYTKMIWYLDPETWQILYSDRYDRQGKLWKVLDQMGNVGSGYNNVPVSAFSANQMIDVQRIHSTNARANFDFGVEFDPRMFTLKYLQKRGY